MINYFNFSNRSEVKLMLDMAVIILGIVLGSLITFVGLWLWLTYQADPTHSLLALFSQNLVELMPQSARQFLGQEALTMGLPLAGESRAYWYMARAGGIVAYFLLWLSVIWGLTLSTKVTGRLVAAPLAYGLHEFLSLGAGLFAAIHALVLLGDRYINFNVFHLVFPFTAPYEPIWTGLGTVAFYLTVVLTASFYIRRQIGQKTWRTLHYLTFGVYALALLHGFLAGSDSQASAMKLIYLVTGAGVLFLTYYRLFTLKVKPAKRARR